MAQRRTKKKPRAAELGFVLKSGTAKGRLLAASAVLFARDGVDGPSVEDILVFAGVSRRTFYKHFASREDVLEELHRTLSESFLSITATAADSAKSPSESIVAAIDVFIALARRGGGLFPVLQGEAMRPGSRLSTRRQEVFAELAAIHKRALERAGLAAPHPVYLHGVLAGVEAILHRVSSEGRFDGARAERVRALATKLMMTALSVPHQPA